MKSLFYLSIRFLLRHPWHSVLSILGIALGVAVVFAIDITNESARRGFSLSNSALSGGASHRIHSPSGDIDERVYAELRIKHGLRQIAPVVSGYVGVQGDRFLLLGIDPFTDYIIRSYGQTTSNPRTTQLFDAPNAAVILASTADRLSVSVAGNVMIETDGGHHDLSIVALIDATNSIQTEGLRNVIVTDIAVAQKVLNKIGRISHIDVNTDDIERLLSIIPPSLNLVENANRNSTFDQITRAFNLNLTALSLLALVIGAFLIFNAMTLSVIQRRELFATLRAMGVTKSEIFGTVILEASLLGFMGLLLGLGLGYWLSKILLHLVSRTINDLYFVVQIQSVTLAPISIIKATLLGLGGTIVAAWMPAIESLRVTPSIGQLRSQLEEHKHKLSVPALLVGVSLWIIATATLLVSDRSIVAGFSALFFIIFGFVCITPIALVQGIRFLQPLLSGLLGVFGKMAAQGVRSSLSRTQVAVAALTIAVSTIIGVSIMITSFRASVSDWLTNYLRADIYVSQSGNYNIRAIEPTVIEEIIQMRSVHAVSRGRWRKLETEAGVIRLFVLDMDHYAFNNFQFKNKSADSIWDGFRQKNNVIVSEPYAYHHRLGIGDQLSLATETGPQLFTVIGVFTDYGSDQGTVVMHRSNYDLHWDDPMVTSMAIYLRDGADSIEFLDQLNSGPLRNTNLHAIPNRHLRERSLEIFDQTFVITDVLRLVAIIIAIIGIFSALMAIHMERAREFMVLRAMGTTPTELLTVITTESGLMGAIAGILACPLGVVTAYVLIFIINQRSFGWSMQMHLPLEPLLTAIILSIVTAVVAGLYPARILTRGNRAIMAARYH